MVESLSTVSAAAFGAPDHIAVERGLAEFRSGRPVVIEITLRDCCGLAGRRHDRRAASRFPADLRAERLRTVVTASRARALGISAAGPVALAISDRARRNRGLFAGRGCRRAWLDVLDAGANAAEAIELAKLAQRLPALLLADVTAGNQNATASLMRMRADAIMQFKQAAISSLAVAAEADVPLNGASAARFVIFRDAMGSSSTAVIVGKPDLSQPVPLRLHSACLTGDVFGSRRCDCGDQLRLAIGRLDEEGGGVILYLEQEGRGLGLANKIRAYKLQDAGLDTLDANTALGFDDDERDYGIAARMLQILGCTRVRLLTNNPAKLDGLAQAGIEVCGRIPLHGRGQCRQPPLSDRQGDAGRTQARSSAGGAIGPARYYGPGERRLRRSSRLERRGIDTDERARATDAATGASAIAGSSMGSAISERPHVGGGHRATP